MRAARRVATVRKIYVLPAELVERIQQYQCDENLTTEVGAVRLLLDQGLAEVDARRPRSQGKEPS